MAHLVSAAALTAAGTVLRHYSISLRPPEELSSGRLQGLEADERCAAILIDYATNVFEIATLRPELRYWQTRLHYRTATAPQLAAFLHHCLEAFAKIPQRKTADKPMVTVMESPAEFGGHPSVYELSKAAMEAARFLFYYYRVAPLNGFPDPETDRVRVASLVESSLGLSRVLRALPVLEAAGEQLRRGSATENEIREQFRKLGVLLEYLPNYENRDEEVKRLYSPSPNQQQV